ncbi:hypothetical protein Cgig2_009404 [Carnegiea gigantea]|uniref:Beta-glucosidase n=1 Tax=Carnegiea gigantea TaxID=171969 RepID=A0A9Q1JSA8_9CARY|nr:hypothetical protein Cgig2_009404 [Carnegiea gigantea]
MALTREECIVVYFLHVLLILMIHANCECSATAGNISRKSFPNGFVFGTASSAYQYEGAVKEGGRGPSVWDKFAHTFGRITDSSNADVAEDQYHRYQEDIGLMKNVGVDAYRFSISWSRIFPNGTGQVNQAGVDYYNNLIDSLLANGIEPYVTIFHWDTPQALEDRYKSWLSPRIIVDFGIYAKTLYEKFGDRVKYWITVNEPHVVTIQGYDFGIFAPGRCSILHHLFCKAGNSATEPYIVAHHLILAHATAAKIYKKKYQKKQGGWIGATFDVIWYEPLTNKTEDIEAAQRALDFHLGWFLDPLMFGDYPRSMRERVGKRLPKFCKAEKALMKGSLDFVGINHYTTYYAWDDNTHLVETLFKDVLSDSGVITLPFDSNGKPIGERANSIWLYVVPRGMRELMKYIKHKYGNPPVIITENGMDDSNDPLKPIGEALKDDKRIRYHSDYLQHLAIAINEDGCNVKGYFAWSLLDNWEWVAGYTSRFGLYYVDYTDNLKRYPKNSLNDINRTTFPQGFVFGTASSAYQYEGAVKEDGRGPCVWDKFAHTFGKTLDFSNADVADDHYHRYQEDIGLMKDMGMDAYRFSISWTRIFPDGVGQINRVGVDHYNNFINALLAKGIEPYVTIFHWDTPQALEDKYSGWLSPQIINDFAAYSETLFEKFGDRVKN